MKTTRESKKLSSSSLILAALSALMLTGLMSKEASAAITCKTNFGERSFTIEQNSVAFHSEQIDGRSISSTVDSVTKKTHTGFKKTIYKDGYRNLIHIEDEKNFNSNNDFLAITSPKGHKMTFPINCSLL